MMMRLGSIILQEIYLEGFRGFESGIKVNFNEGKTVMYGENGEGKTSIGEGIVWALTGRDLFGASRDINVKNLNSGKVIVDVFFQDDKGTNYKLERHMASQTVIRLNGKRIKQNELEVMLPVDSFLTSFNPMYFLGLNPTPARKMLASLLPKLSKEDVLKEMTEVEYEYLKDEKFEEDSIGKYLKAAQKNAREKREQMKHMEGYVEKLQVAIEVPEETPYDERLLKGKRQELEVKLSNRPTLPSVESIQSEHTSLTKQREQLSYMTSPEESKVAEINGQQRELTMRISHEQEKVYVPEPCNLEVERKQLLNEYGYIKNMIDNLKVQGRERNQPFDTKCPTCQEDLRQDKILHLKNEQNRDIGILVEKIREQEAKMEEIKTKGKSIAAAIEKKREQENVQLQMFERKKNETIVGLNEQILNLTKEKRDLQGKIDEFNQMKQAQNQQFNEKIQGLERQLAEHRDKNGPILATYEAELAHLRKDIANLEQEERNALISSANRDTLMKKEEERLNELKKYSEQMSVHAADIQEDSNRIHYAKRFMLKRVDILHKQMESHLDKVTINLQRFNEKTGEITDCFEIKYEGKPILVCSLSERMKAGMEISKMISSIQGIEYPVFLDNAESITHYEKKHQQIIEMNVQKGSEFQRNENIEKIEV